jgi:hypothetical protein
MLPRAAVSADDLQSAGVTLRRLERFWIRAADLERYVTRLGIALGHKLPHPPAHGPG